MSTDFVSRDTTHKARKPHRCWYCGERIQIGETYAKRVGVSYGDFWTMRFHDACEEFAIEHAGYGDQDAYETHDESEFCLAMAEHKAKASGFTCIKGGKP